MVCVHEVESTHQTPTKHDCEVVSVYDVLCGRNKDAFNNIGNRRFRVLVSISLHEYNHIAIRRKEKSQVVRNIIAATKASGGRFLQETNGILHELSDKDAQIKVGHAIRDMTIAKKKSSSDTSSNSTGSSCSSRCKVKSAIKSNMNLRIPENIQHVNNGKNHVSLEKCDVEDCNYSIYEPIQWNSNSSEACNAPIHQDTSNMPLSCQAESDVESVFDDVQVSEWVASVDLDIESPDEIFSPVMVDFLLKQLID
jgi:hypothetical protein